MSDKHDDERWRSVVGFEDLYDVSDRGRVRSGLNTFAIGLRKPGRVMKNQLNERGYYTIALRKDLESYYFRIHRLVIEAFFGPRPQGFEVNHKDCNKVNNFASNLEYVTPKQNRDHALLNGLIPAGEGMYNAKLNEKSVIDIVKRLHTGERIVNIASRYCVSPSAISNIKRGLNWVSVPRLQGMRPIVGSTKRPRRREKIR